MRITKIALFLIMFILLVGVYVQANEKKSVDQQTFSFSKQLESSFLDSSISQNDLTRFAASSERKARSFRNMGIAGAIVFGLSFVFLIVGIALFAYAAFSVFGAAFGTMSFAALISAGTTAVYLAYGGLALIAISQIMFWVGLPLMIVGFAVSAYHRKKVSISIDADLDRGLIFSGISIKL